MPVSVPHRRGPAGARTQGFGDTQRQGGNLGRATDPRWMAPQTLVGDVNVTNGAALATGPSRTSVTPKLDLVYAQSGGAIIYKSSPDEGATWSTGVSIATGNTPLDQGFCADPVTGSLHLFYTRNEGQGGLPCVLYYRRSLDTGTTWSAEVVIDDGVAHGNNRFIRIAAGVNNGHVHLAYVSISETDFTTDGLYYRRSTDNGLSFATAIQPFPNAVAPSRPFIEIENQTVHMCWMDARFGSLYAGNPGEAFYGRSLDDGVTWTDTRITNTADIYGGGTVLRPCLCSDHDRVTIVWQDPHDNQAFNSLYYTHSEDSGTTWSPNTLLVGDGTFSAEHAYLAQQDNFVSLVWADYRYSSINGAGSSRAFARFSLDGGISFGPEQLVNSATLSQAPENLITPHYVLCLSSATPTLSLFRQDTVPVPATGTLFNPSALANAGPPPSSAWSQGPSDFTAGEGLVILSNAITRKATGGYRQDDYFNSQIFGPDCEAWATLGAVGSNANDSFGLFLRLNKIAAGTSTGYSLNWAANGIGQNVFIANVLSGATLVNLTQDLKAGDTLLFRAIGATLEAWYQPAGGAFTLLGSTIDSTYGTAGFLGLNVANGQSTTISLFGGGTSDQILGVSAPAVYLPRKLGPRAVGPTFFAGLQVPTGGPAQETDFVASAAAVAAASALLTAETDFSASAASASAASVTLTAPTFFTPSAASAAAASVPLTAPTAFSPSAQSAAAASLPLTAASLLSLSAASMAAASLPVSAATFFTPSAASTSSASAPVSATTFVTASAQSASAASIPLTAATFFTPLAAAVSTAANPLSAPALLSLAASSAAAASAVMSQAFLAPTVVSDSAASADLNRAFLAPTSASSSAASAPVTAASLITAAASSASSAAAPTTAGALISPTAASAASASAPVSAATFFTASAQSASTASIPLTAATFFTASAQSASAASALLSAATFFTASAASAASASVPLTAPTFLTLEADVVSAASSPVTTTAPLTPVAAARSTAFSGVTAPGAQQIVPVAGSASSASSPVSASTSFSASAAASSQASASASAPSLLAPSASAASNATAQASAPALLDPSATAAASAAATVSATTQIAPSAQGASSATIPSIAPNIPAQITLSAASSSFALAPLAVWMFPSAQSVSSALGKVIYVLPSGAGGRIDAPRAGSPRRAHVGHPDPASTGRA